MLPRQGYKIVDGDMKSLYGDVTWTLNVEQRLADGPLVVCHRGFHFCARASDCLYYAPWHPTYRLLRVSVPDDADVITDGSAKCCASALVAVKDVTDTDELRRLRIRVRLPSGLTKRIGIDANRRLCAVVRSEGYRYKAWGSSLEAWTISIVQRGNDIIVDDQVVAPQTVAWGEAAALLDRVEPFETA
jgi:hypothetical protein